MDDTLDARRERIKEIFANARKLDAASQAAMLDHECANDPELRAEVEQLINQYVNAEKFFRGSSDSVRVAATLVSGPTTFSPGEIVAGRFLVVGLIGKGGMGEVYEVQDRQLARTPIALKTIRMDMAADERAVARLKSELELARQVTHPNVCRVHDVGQHQTAAGAVVHFFTMELLKGESLASRLQRLGRMNAADALPLVKQMAAGIDAAHSVGVVHGDFKPANVVLVGSEGGAERAVVTDFGLARLLPEGATLLSTTHESVRWGTPDYMAPEQFRGRRATRATDIYALGVVLSEMVTGHRPYTAGSPFVLAPAEPTRTPRLPPDHVHHLDRRWQSAILRSLDPNPDARFKAAGDVVSALEGERPKRRWWIGAAALAAACAILAAIPSVRNAVRERLTGVPVVGVEQSIALLPSLDPKDLNRTPDTDALSIGLTAAVTDQLGAQLRDDHRFLVVPSVEVIGTGLDTPARAQQALSVNLIVTVRLTQGAGQTLVAMVLHQASPDGLTVTPTRTKDITVGDQAFLEAEVLKSVTQMLGVTVPTNAGQPRETVGTIQPAAAKSYLLGRGFLVHGPLTSAIAKLEDAIQRDRDYVAAYVGLSDAYLREYDATKDRGFITKARAASDSALERSPGNARVRVNRGRVFRATGLNPRAIDEFREALKYDPNNADARNNLASAYEAVGDLQKAEDEYGTAIGQHPHYFSGYEDLGAFHFRHGRTSEAASNFEMGARYAPSNVRAVTNLGSIYLMQGNLTSAEIELKTAVKLAPDDATLRNNLGWVYIFLDRFPEALDQFKLAVKAPDADSVMWSSLARAYRWAGSHRKDEEAAYQRALELADQEMLVDPTDAERRANRAYLWAENGRKAKALDEIKDTRALAPENRTVLFTSALVYELTGNRTGALEALEKAARDGYAIAKIKYHPDFKVLRTDPGYRRVLAAPKGAA